MTEKNVLKRSIKIAAGLLLLLVFLGNAGEREALAAEAEEAEVEFEHSGGKSCAKLTDGATNSSLTFSKGQSLKISSETPLQGLYIKWSATKIPGEWTLLADGKEFTCGTHNFLHEYVPLPKGTRNCTLIFPNKLAGIVEIDAYGEGDLPEDVQIWEPPCEKADFLVFSTHADDEVLFLGGVCVTYAGERDLLTQVVYLCDFTLDDYGYMNTTREHEKLDGLWTMGVRNYPVNGSFPDVYSNNIKKAMTQYDYDAVLEFVTENIRRFKPLVLISQDFNGEYGHGAHMMLAKAAADAMEISADAAIYPESAEKYGTWDVPKAYYHLYQENKIRLDLRKPLTKFNGRTSLEVQKEAYKKHVTQQGYWFYVSDVKENIDCAAFGLYRTLVGEDTGTGDMLENITTYEKKLEDDLKRTKEIGDRMYFRHGIYSLRDCLKLSMGIK
ncbi:MAG: PIG-L family deacetylase [Lachnospiraceae bacterium]|nr:PIG-L family deacetylase [Lachnospiraceae bacterium]